jgi:hypothetical protein
VDWSPLTTPGDSKIVNESWFAADLEIITKKPSKGDAWIRKCSQTMLTQKKSMKTVSVATGKSSTKQVPKVTSGFFNASSPF